MATSSQRRAHSRRLARVVRLAADVMDSRGRAHGVVLGVDGKVDVTGAIALALDWSESQIEGKGMITGPWTNSRGSISLKAAKAHNEYEECLQLLNEYVDTHDIARGISRFSDNARNKRQVTSLLRKAATWIEERD